MDLHMSNIPTVDLYDYWDGLGLRDMILDHHWVWDQIDMYHSSFTSTLIVERNAVTPGCYETL